MSTIFTIISSCILIVVLLLLAFLQASHFKMFGQLIENAAVPALAVVFGTTLTITKQPVDALLCLIAAFIAVIYTFMRTGIEFIGLSFLIVYIGAIAILFLFVVILFNLNEIFTDESKEIVNAAALLMAVLVILDYINNRIGLHDWALMLWSADDFYKIWNTVDRLYYSSLDVLSITKIYYSSNWDMFITTGWVLLVAMVGAIAITLALN